MLDLKDDDQGRNVPTLWLLLSPDTCRRLRGP